MRTGVAGFGGRIRLDEMLEHRNWFAASAVTPGLRPMPLAMPAVTVEERPKG
jgi:hypothetical protein